jgi:4-hydroxybenzoate polyprenyltransferase
MVALFWSLRPRQWTKNLLVLAGLLFSRRWDNTEAVFNALLGFAIFCALSGVVYIINDLADLEQDRQHPEKRFRPIAAGRISPIHAGMGAFLICVGALWASFAFLPLSFFWLSAGYLVLITVYSFYFKHRVVMDILALAMGFVIRAIAGIVAVQVPSEPPMQITSYFLLTTLFLALFLAIGKRRSELSLLGKHAKSHRKVLQDYHPEMLNHSLTISMTGTLFSYALWTAQGQFAQEAGAPSGVASNPLLMAATMPFVIYGMFRYLWLVYKHEKGGAPETLLLEDRPLLICVFLWTVTTVAVLATVRIA